MRNIKNVNRELPLLDYLVPPFLKDGLVAFIERIYGNLRVVDNHGGTCDNGIVLIRQFKHAFMTERDVVVNQDVNYIFHAGI